MQRWWWRKWICGRNGALLEIKKKIQETMRLVDAERMTKNRLENRIKTESRQNQERTEQ